jgi:hypothetical protein
LRDQPVKNLRIDNLSALPTQICFEKDGYIICNFVIQKGHAIASKKGWIKFPVPSQKKELPSDDESSSTN